MIGKTSTMETSKQWQSQGPKPLPFLSSSIHCSLLLIQTFIAHLVCAVIDNMCMSIIYDALQRGPPLKKLTTECTEVIQQIFMVSLPCYSHKA